MRGGRAVTIALTDLPIQQIMIGCWVAAASVFSSCHSDKKRLEKAAMSTELKTIGHHAMVSPISLQPPKAVTEGLLHMIERVARDPSVDIARLEKLMDMHERVTARNAEQAFNNAMSAAQSEMLPVAKDANNPQTRSKYASYVALDNAIRDIYTRHGFGLTFDTGEGAPELHVRVLCDVIHSGGHTRGITWTSQRTEKVRRVAML